MQLTKSIIIGTCSLFLIIAKPSWAQPSLKPATQPAAPGAADFVRSVAVDGLVEQSAHLFDLQGKTLRFTPQNDGSYKVETRPPSVVPCDKTLEDKSAEGGYFIKGWAISLPFSFPIGGKKWDRIYINRNGNISFEKSEAEYWPARDPWADGGMRSVAAAMDSRSAAGLEQMIAVFWAHVDPDPHRIDVRIKLEKDTIAITWNVMHVAWGQAHAGANSFQARLYHSGMIEMSYQHIVDRDGIVGLFTGQPVSGQQLHHWQFKGKAPDPSVAIESADVYDAGSILKFVINMKENAITRINEGTSLEYRCFVSVGDSKSQISVAVSDEPRMSCWLGSAPRTAGFHVQGKSVVMYISKVLLPNVRQFTPEWNVVWWGFDGRGVTSEPNLPAVDLTHAAAGQVHLSSANGIYSGNVFEVFHYAAVSKSSETILKKIYQNSPGEDDIALVFTDFRIDDLYGQGGGAIAANFRIRGVGPVQDHPRSTADIGSSRTLKNPLDE
ncbi:MAG TPA: hypothetical protein VHD56_02420 [Tepidisphaeraceae bacterium]|nr:hypothetical protein [Tepidisphaeraceae bacterium]